MALIWCPAQGAGRKSFCQQIKRIASCSYFTCHFAYQMNNMRIILHLPVMRHCHIITNTAQVISCKVHQHHMLCIFFCIFQQSSAATAGPVSSSPVLLKVPAIGCTTALPFLITSWIREKNPSVYNHHNQKKTNKEKD